MTAAVLGQFKHMGEMAGSSFGVSTYLSDINCTHICVHTF